FFCERVTGRAPLPSQGEPGDPVPQHRASLGRQFVEALAALHRFDWKSAPELAGWGEGIDPRNTAERQVEACLDDYRRLVVRPQPAVVWAIAWLRRNAPRAAHLSIVHGDFRIGNFLVEDGRI